MGMLLRGPSGGKHLALTQLFAEWRRLGDDIRMKNKKSARATDRSALPRKIACGDVCGDPGGALYHMSRGLKAALTQLFAE